MLSANVAVRLRNLPNVQTSYVAVLLFLSEESGAIKMYSRSFLLHGRHSTWPPTANGVTEEGSGAAAKEKTMYYGILCGKYVALM